jgi:hypothetical protein
MHVTLAEFALPWEKRYPLLFVPGYSPRPWLMLYERQYMRAHFTSPEAAFVFFRGVVEEVLFHQAGAVMTRDQRLASRQFEQNQEFLPLGDHWSFIARCFRPY